MAETGTTAGQDSGQDSGQDVGTGSASVPAGEPDNRYGEDGVAEPGWPRVRGELEKAPLFWLTTVRPDGRPHVTPLIGVWADGSLFFCTGAHERKAKNLAENQHCVLTTGTNELNSGLDIVLEGDAIRVRDTARLQWIADGYEEKYGSIWHFDVHEDVFWQQDNNGGHDALVFEVAPVTVFGFGKGPYSQTKYRFDGA